MEVSEIALKAAVKFVQDACQQTAYIALELSERNWTSSNHVSTD